MAQRMRSLVVLGITAGIALLFIGGIVGTVFPATPTDLTAYKITATVKLLGIGGLICSMIVGGLRLEGMDKTLRLLLLVLGLVMLVIYTAGSSVLEWNIPSYAQGNQTAYNFRPTGMGIPGFDSWTFLAAMGVVVTALLLRRRYRSSA